MDLKEQQEIRQKLEEAFPDKTSEERENMFQRLVNKGGATEGFYRIINGKITRVGVYLGNPKLQSYFSTEYDTDSFYDD